MYFVEMRGFNIFNRFVEMRGFNIFNRFVEMRVFAYQEGWER